MTTRYFIISGAVLGIVAAFLAYAGNPANMGICAACFLRDTSGALGFHSVQTLQYLRPELIGLVLGGFLASLFWTKEFAPKNSTATFSSFFLGVFAMIGALVFLGCPWRAFLRLGGGDMTAIAGFLGLAAGVGIGLFFKKNGYKVDKSVSVSKNIGFLPVIFSVLLLLALVFGLKIGENGALFSSVKGPAAQHAALFISLIGGLVVGVFMQKSKFCSVGAFARAYKGDFSMFWGVVAIIASATIANLALGQYKFGFEAQPIAHNNFVWNFLGMVLAGLCFSLSEGCPGKHLVQMGTGNLHSGIFVIGMMAGAGFAHNFLLASSPAGITPYAPWAVGLGFVFAVYVGVLNRAKA